MADLIFTAHALGQMRARKLPALAAQHVVEYADVLDRDDGCTEYSGVWDGRTILVVACGGDEPYRVRTVIKIARRPRR